MAKKCISDVNVRSQRVLMRVDFNVPIEEERILDDARLRDALESIHSVADRGGRLILMSHRGRPKGWRFEPDLSLGPCALRLNELLNRPVGFITDCVGDAVRRRVDQMRDGDVLLLENLRFHEGEVRNAADFAGQLASLGEIYCNEAFAASHRGHASLVGVPELMQGRPRVAGIALDREVSRLRATLDRPARPFVVVVGGVHVEDKVAPLLHLLGRVDHVLVGGALAYGFMAAEHKAVGESLLGYHHVQDAANVLQAAGKSRTHLWLPGDHVCGREPSSATLNRVAHEVIPERWMGLDIGPHTVTRYVEVLHEAQTIFWTGPMGVWETHPFDIGTKEIALGVAHATLVKGASSIAAGGSTLAAIRAFNLEGQFSHVSTGGTATLLVLQGAHFPSLELLDERLDIHVTIQPDAARQMV